MPVFGFRHNHIYNIDMRFKTWLFSAEGVISPGGGIEDKPEDLERLAKEIGRRGAGAFPSGGDNPPKAGKTAATAYGDGRFTRKVIAFPKKI
jgi:hypothetical protein